MTGLGADRTLTPDYPGLTDKASIREAPPELGIKDELLTDEDEAYWKQYRAAPKLFLNLRPPAALGRGVRRADEHPRPRRSTPPRSSASCSRSSTRPRWA